ncbi:AAA family ATPase [Membranihabitans marinus]|uniref:AAA family ATPase n=1 Tax=Membranihabitans marinus TaxID=1227546 RepID=UPI001F167909|nr:ATP-binding protein [Membranihabitans marinus]
MEKELERTSIKIGVVGPESTGKSTITKILAQHYNCHYVPEYARYYCEHLENEYTLQDEVNMYYGQIALEDSILSIAENDLIICDTTFITIKIWSDHLFGHTPQIVLDELLRRRYDHYLLMDIDMPWEDDPLRDFPDKRSHFLEVWKEELTALNASYDLISGLGHDRTMAALHSIDEYMRKNSTT